MDRRQMLAIIGCFVLFVGVFAPLISIPIMGSMNYFQNGRGDGIIVMGFAVVSLAAALARRFKWLWLTGVGSLGMLGFTLFNFQYRFSKMKAEMNKGLEDNPFRGLADLAVQSVQMQWGWAVLLVGGVMLLIAAGMREGVDGQQQANPPPQPPASR
ncbi:MAG: hypothetical protein FJ280_13130 [Planctomycetes bacterium]|nr:hypothetical protein [Planctomycetota bacterium]